MIKQCKQCHKEFKTTRKVAKYCSYDCMGLAKRGIVPGHLVEKLFKKGQKATGTPFKKGLKPYTTGNGYLVKGDKNPNYKGGLVTVKCSNCNSELKRKKCTASKFNNFFCDSWCRGSWISKNLSGENSFCYKNPEDRISPIMNLLRVSYDGRSWKKQVNNRDNGCCLKCGSKKGVVAHHISSFTRFPELRFSVDNGATLCISCHTKFHKKYTTRKFTSDDFYEFLSDNQTNL